ncbi:MULTISPECIES: hypothetical protein [Pelosinus]|uniref:DUF927 domain-containing protein n=1 Tax=Pelosinus fermentans B4 TaxID=1149862 RepID=I8RIC2_9FIRM|nr:MULTISPECIES: hypothetical protein [Pelosinus]EIW19603.1 hypothetical protein FB4_2786 [Pelosinus fermentans B4]EIW24663.1 hypothetical protein FA11_3054 [Pelosinus fermentans A11]OAM96056.1 hypothetical protein FR7_04078 [Pelosinus fermentans DSM 17108]SDR35868.1 hypothetical protein SAMN04515679_4248 [Pelosinus fermentans]
MTTAVIFEILSQKCEIFTKDLEKYQNGTLEEKLEFSWATLFVNSGYDEAAREFVKYSFHETALDGFESELEAIKSKKCKPTLCKTFGCNDEQIKKCHELITRNSSNDINNSPANLITESKIKTFINASRYKEQLEEIFIRLETDPTAYLSEDFLEAAADLKVNNLQEYTKLVEEFKQNNIKTQKFEKEVESVVKRLKKSAPKSSEGFSNKPSVDLPEILQPYNKNLENSKFFVSENGQICYEKEEKDDVKIITAANFVARITESFIFDDGQVQIRKFKIRGVVNATDQLPEIIVEAKDFNSLSWVISQWGNRAILMDEATVRSVREFIQTVSMDAPERIIHYQLGWKMVNNRWSYLYSNGLIGDVENMVAEINELPNYLFRNSDINEKEAIKVVFDFLKLTKPEITFPLIAHAFLSISIEKLSHEQLEPKYLLWIYGQSGSFKTALSILLLNLFGEFTSPPATFSDTINALEKKAYLSKDSLFLVDDFHPSSSPNEARYKTGVAQNLTRKYGDRISKGRAKSNMSLSVEYKPRGNAVCTSEDLLLGHSTNSRHMSIEIYRGEVDKELLTELQSKTEYLNKAMRVFIEWHADKIMNDEKIKFKPEFLKYRELAQDSNRHLRFAEAVAYLQIGFTTLLKFANDYEVITDEEVAGFSKTAFDVFIKLAEKQNQLAQSEDVADKFMLTIKELIDAKEIEPADILKPLHLNKTSTICYHDSDYYYFIPQSIYARVSEFLKRKDEMLSITDRMLWKILRERKYIVTPELPENDNHQFAKKKIGLAQVRVVQIEKKKLENF